LRYSVEWQEDVVSVVPEERATAARFRLWLDEQNVCLHLQGDTVSDHIAIPLYTLADGLVQDWWRLFGGRDRMFSLIAHRDGLAVPDIRLAFDGAAFEIAAPQRPCRNPDRHFWAGPVQVMNRAQAEAELGRLVALVLARLADRGVGETGAALRWARIQASRENPVEAGFCEAAGALGLDPYRICEADADIIRQAALLFTGEPLTEFLAGIGTADCRRLLDWVRATEGRVPHRTVVPELRPAAESACRGAPGREGEPGWALGYRRARAMRHAMGFGEARRFASHRALANAFGTSPFFGVAPEVDGIRLFRNDRADGTHLHLRAHGGSAQAQAGHLVTLARGVGDVACFPEPHNAPVNDLNTAYRQAAGRAFAAEFLAPVNEVLSMREAGRDLVSMAEEFAVPATMIEDQMINAARIAAACG
jgi:hypothetical protein